MKSIARGIGLYGFFSYLSCKRVKNHRTQQVVGHSRLGPEAETCGSQDEERETDEAISEIQLGIYLVNCRLIDKSNLRKI